MDLDKMNHLDINRDSWDKRTKLHVNSDFYRHKDFLTGQTSLKEIELKLLGDLTGKKVLHLQCHFGQDSISLARMGAIVTAVDLSPIAIEFAKKTALEMDVEVEFICSDILSPNLLVGRAFDLVYATYGTICWLPDLKPWAQLVNDKLSKDGQLLLIEFHPILDIYDDEMQNIRYSYFNVEPIKGATVGSYAEKSTDEIPYVVWNHPISDVLSSLLRNGLHIAHFEEYPFAPYPCFTGSVANGKDRYVIERFGSKMPMCYSLIVRK
jgi:SAM-dependent methyltransferase